MLRMGKAIPNQNCFYISFINQSFIHSINMHQFPIMCKTLWWCWYWVRSKIDCLLPSRNVSFSMSQTTKHLKMCICKLWEQLGSCDRKLEGAPTWISIKSSFRALLMGNSWGEGAEVHRWLKYWGRISLWLAGVLGTCIRLGWRGPGPSENGHGWGYLFIVWKKVSQGFRMLCELMKFLWCKDFSVEKSFIGSEGKSYPTGDRTSKEPLCELK